VNRLRKKYEYCDKGTGADIYDAALDPHLCSKLLETTLTWGVGPSGQDKDKDKKKEGDKDKDKDNDKG
jgi:hypothetical protein